MIFEKKTIFLQEAQCIVFMQVRDIFIAIIVAFLFGSLYIAVKINFEEAPALLSISIRCLLTSILCFFIAKPKISFKELYKLSVTFMLFVGPLYYAVYIGVNASLTVVMTQLAVPFSLIIAYFSLKESFTRYAIIGTALAFMGVGVIVINPLHFNRNYFALLILMLAALSEAQHNVESRKLCDVPAISLYCWSNLVAAPHLFLISYFLEGNPLVILEKTTYIFWSAMFYSIVASVFPHTLWIYLLQRYSVCKVMPYYLLMPGFGIFLAVIILHEQLSAHLIIGGLIVMAGIYISQKKQKMGISLKNT